LKILSSKIEDIRQPSGKDRKSPARTCLDLYLSAQEQGIHLDNGLYWVDPNAGCEADAIEVWCDFNTYPERVETCVYPTQGKIAKSKHASSNTGAHQWFTDLGGNTISYDPQREARVPRADYSTQITFMRLLSSRARQTMTYHCKGGKSDLKIRGTGDAEFFLDHEDEKMRFKVIDDGCERVGSSWGKTTIELNTKKTAYMPIRDIASKDIGANGQEFGFDIEPVCFS